MTKSDISIPMTAFTAAQNRDKSRTFWKVGIVAAIIVLYCVLSLIYTNDALDDHWITFRYARNLARGAGLVWNVGERPVEGYTCFLWVVINSLFIRGGILPLLGSKIVSLLTGVAMIGGVFSGLNRLVRGFVPRVVLALLISTCPVLLFYAQSGMETILFTTIIFFATLTWIGRRQNPDYGTWGAISSTMFAISALTRPEGALVFFAVLGSELYTYIQGSRKSPNSGPSSTDVLAFSLPFLVIGGIYFLWRIRYFGYVLPNTYYAKHNGNTLNNLPIALNYLADAYSNYLVFPLAFLVGISVRSALPSTWRQIALPLLTPIVAYVLFVFLMGGDDRSAFPSVRLLAPIFPVLYLMMVSGLEEAVQNQSGRKRNAAYALAFVLCAMSWQADQFLLIHEANPLIRTDTKLGSLPKAVLQKLSTLNADSDDPLSQWIKQNSSPSDLIAMGFAGRVPFHIDRPVLDMLGLNDIHIAHLRPLQRGIDVKMDPDYVLARKPKLIFITVDAPYWNNQETFKQAGGWKIGDQRLLDLLRIDPEYEFVKDAPTKICVFRRIRT